MPAGFVADGAGGGDAELADVDVDADGAGDDRARRCFVLAADGVGESEAGTLATAAWKGRPAQDPADPAASGSHAEGACGMVTLSVAEAGAGAGPRVR